MNTHWTDRLSDYIDGELTPAEREACAAHLATCATCRDVVTELEAVITFAGTDADRDPAVDHWPVIESRISRLAPAAGPGVSRRTVAFTLPQLALAASLLIAVSAAVTHVGLGRNTDSAATEAPIRAVAEPVLTASSDAMRANFADEQFDQAVADLEQILHGQRDVLDPRTVMVIERNLATIDEAIRQARAALDADPANTFLNSHLADARRRKLDLLRRATNLGSSPSGD